MKQIICEKESSKDKEGSSFFDKCRNQAFVYLSIRDHNRRELSTKLRTKGYSDSVVKSVLDSLEADGSLDEERYVRSFIRSSNRRHPEGRSMILQRLAAKGADRETSRRVVSDVYDESYTRELVLLAREQILGKGKAQRSEDVHLALMKLGFSNNDIRIDD